MDQISVRQADWDRDRAVLQELRRQVFVVEQGIPERLEWDRQDRECLHLLATLDRRHAAGTARVTPGGRIGRLAVLPQWRRRGIGTALLGAAMDLCQRSLGATPFLHAQVSAAAFYRRFGFDNDGAVFEEAGIAHQAMRWRAGAAADA